MSGLMGGGGGAAGGGAAGGGFGARMRNIWQDPLFQMGVGVLGGNQGRTGDQAFRNSLQGGMQGVQLGQRNVAAIQQQQALTQWQKLREQQLAAEEERKRQWQAMAPQMIPALMSGDPEVKQQAITGLMGADPGLMRQMLPSLIGGPAGAKPTSLMQNIEASGAQPGTPEYQEAMRMAVMRPATSVSISTGAKLPTNYMWRDPDNKAIGIKPIPGSEPEKAQRKEEHRLGSTQSSLDRYEKALEATGPTFFMGAGKAKLQTAYNDLMLEMKELYNLGVLNGPDLEIMERTLTNPTTLTAQALEAMGGMEAFKGQLDLVQQKLDDAKLRARWLSTGSDQPPPATPPPPPGFVLTP